MNIGIIADGNRRWAKENGLSSAEGHEAGFRAVSDNILPFCRSHPRISALTIYAFSTENWKRSPVEIAHLFRLYNRMIDEWRQSFLEHKIRLCWAGRREKVNIFLRRKTEDLEKETANFSEFTVYLCLDYGAHDEIVRAMKTFSQVSISEKEFENALEVPPLDIIIRSGGERRLSNFCLWQAAYAELFFESEFLPDFTKEKMVAIMEAFFSRDRRKGK